MIDTTAHVYDEVNDSYELRTPLRSKLLYRELAGSYMDNEEPENHKSSYIRSYITSVQGTE
jgi:hypothetical protein